MAHIYEYCLKCERKGNCLCGTTDYQFSVNSKLRIPSTKNKVRFRKFLDDCPTFVNCVPDELQPKFLDLLRKVKYFNKTINGKTWTNIGK